MRFDEEKQQLIINANYELFILLITILSIMNSIIWLFPIEPYARNIIMLIEYGISTFLMVDFFVRLIKTPHKRVYLINYYGWMEFLGSLPIIGLRLVRLVRILIIGRKIRRSDFPEIENVVLERRAQSTLLLVIFLVIVLFEISGIAILRAELQNPDSNIKTASDALWWAYVTVATVGYGDRYPVTNNGRMVAVFLMTAGVGVFSVLTSFLADWFRRPHKPRSRSRSRLGKNLNKDAHEGLKEIEELLDNYEIHHQKTMDDLRARIAEIEKNLDI